MRRGLANDLAIQWFKAADLVVESALASVDTAVDSLQVLVENVRSSSESLVRGAIIFSHAACRDQRISHYLRCPPGSCNGCAVRGAVFFVET